MSLSDRVMSNLDVVLEEVCRELPSGGDQEVRKVIAEQLLHAAEAGQHSLGELRAIGLPTFAAAARRSQRH